MKKTSNFQQQYKYITSNNIEIYKDELFSRSNTDISPQTTQNYRKDKLLSSNNTNISPQTTQEYTKGKNNQDES
jgi:hypothetical protein